MSKEFVSSPIAPYDADSMIRTSSNRIALSNIGPWSWFIIDYSIAFIFATIAFSLTPYSVEMQEILASKEHAGILSFSFGTGLLIALSAHIVGLHEPNQVRTSLKMLGRCALVSVLGVLVLNVELLLVHYLTVGRLITMYTVIGCTLGLFVVRALVFGLIARNQLVVGFVGSSKFTHLVSNLGETNSAQDLQFISLNLQENESVDLLSWAHFHGVNQIVVDPNDEVSAAQEDLLRLMNASVSVSTFSNFIEKLHLRIPSNNISAQWVIECQEDHAMVYKMAVKRSLDIVIASLTLFVLAPVGLLAALCVKMDSPGPVVFRQVRVGQFGRKFTMFKLRTMVQGAERNGAKWASKSDGRVTRVGAFLRSSRIDEIPQLINVIAGDMSLVGPRPERPEFIPDLESKIPFFSHRVLVKPGITGWAQVNSGYAATEEEFTTKLSFDLYYVKNLSLALDLRILLRTISSFAMGSR